MLTLLSPAKLNLFLLINGRRADGYHDLQTVFQFLDYGDTLHFEARNDDSIELATLNGIDQEENLIYKAAQALKKACGAQTLGASIEIDKRLPMGGGLGGGSSNAATTLLALNQLWELDLSLDKLKEIGLSLGADVPIFVHGHSAWAEGVGERLTDVSLSAPKYLVVHPQVHVCTATLFQHPDLTRDSAAITLAAFLEQGGRNDIGNDFESLARKLYPEIDHALNWLSRWGLPRMTGTGSCVFCELDADISTDDEQAIMDALPSTMSAFIARGCNVSPTHTQLKASAQ